MSFQILHINGIMFHVFLCLTSLSMIISRSTHVAAKSMISFFSWLSSISLCVCARAYVHTHVYVHTRTRVYAHTCIYVHTHVCMYTHPHLLYPLLCQWTFRLPRVLAVVNSAAVDRGRMNLFELRVLSDQKASTVSFGGTSRMSSIVAASVYIPTNSVGGTITHFLKQWLCLQRFFTYW